MLARYSEEVCWADVLRDQIVIDLAVISSTTSVLQALLTSTKQPPHLA